ncbi:MAG: hypothetical protein U0574_08350 [Phycisphaerales bacterium]
MTPRAPAVVTCLAFAAAAFAQGSSDPAATLAQGAAAPPAAPAAPAAPPAGNQAPPIPAGISPGMVPAFTNMQLELNALNSMNDAAGQLTDGARRRVTLLTDFVASKNMQADFTTFQQGWKPNSPPLSFQQAYTTALNAEKLRGPVTITTSDFDTLTREVTATTSMVQTGWNSLNSLRGQVSCLSAFVHGKNLWNDYHTFAAARVKQMQADAAAAAQAREAKDKAEMTKEDQARIAALDYLQKQWDSQSHLASSGINMNYSFSQSASQASQFSQTPSTAYTAGTGQNPAVYPVDPYPGVYDYWTGTYWNGYADPYYDVYGGATFGPNGVWNGPDGGLTPAGAFRRGWNPTYHNNPGREVPAGGTRGAGGAAGGARR